MKGIVRFFTILVLLGVVLLAFLFAVRNTTMVSLWLGVSLPEYSVGVLVIAAFILGGLLGLLFGLGLFRRLKYRVKIRQLESRLDKLRDGQDNAGKYSGPTS